MRFRHHRYPWGGHAFLCIVPRFYRPFVWFNRVSVWLTGSLLGYAQVDIMITTRDCLRQYWPAVLVDPRGVGR